MRDNALQRHDSSARAGSVVSRYDGQRLSACASRPVRCAVRARAGVDTFSNCPRTADMRSLARAANQQGERARLVGGQAPWSQFLRGDNTWPLGSNGTCTVALTKRLDHMKCFKLEHVINPKPWSLLMRQPAGPIEIRGLETTPT